MKSLNVKKLLATLDPEELGRQLAEKRAEIALIEELLEFRGRIRKHAGDGAAAETNGAAGAERTIHARAEAFLREHGPATAKAVASAIGVDRGPCYAAMRKHCDRFTCGKDGLWRVAK
jgi:hypothetical protein